MSSFLATKLDFRDFAAHTFSMDTKSLTNRKKIAAAVSAKIAAGGERIWRHEDFSGSSPTAVAQALSRLARAGKIKRVSKGVYHRPRITVFGESKPTPALLRGVAAQGKAKVFPAGVSAANVLGFTSQNPQRPEVATNAASLPKKVFGEETKVNSRRPAAWARLSEREAALLDFLRRRGASSEHSPEETTRRVLKIVSEKGCFERLVKVADTEPPRVRAMLGAIGEELRKEKKLVQKLRRSLNPLSRFHFGSLRALKFAAKWQAKEMR